MNELELIAVGMGTQPWAELSRRQRKRLARFCRTRRFSAGLVIDLGQTCDYRTSLLALVSGQSTNVGVVVDLANADTNCQVWLTNTYGFSGELPLFIQTSDGTASGGFTDPTSGLPAGSFPIGGFVASGGMFWANSGIGWVSGNNGPNAPADSAPLLASGGIVFTSFQRPHRYARLLLTSGNASITNFLGAAGFLSNKRTTGSGGGFSLQPGSGAVSV